MGQIENEVTITLGVDWKMVEQVGFKHGLGIQVIEQGNPEIFLTLGCIFKPGLEFLFGVSTAAQRLFIHLIISCGGQINIQPNRGKPNILSPSVKSRLNGSDKRMEGF
jgi:hypothetical protein